MRRLGYDQERMTRPPPAMRFQAERSNALWHFDMSPSDLKQLAMPPWVDSDRTGASGLMLFSVVDDRSGVAHQKYRCVYGEDVEAALRFLFAAMAPNPHEAKHREERFGPYHPLGGPVPLHRYRRHRKSRREVRADRVGELAPLLVLPRAALSGEDDVVLVGTKPEPVPVQPFRDPDPFHQLVFPSPLAARRAIAEMIRRPLGALDEEDRRFIDVLVARTLSRPELLAAVHERFPQGRRHGAGAC